MQITRTRHSAHYISGDIRLIMRKRKLSGRYEATLFYRNKFVSASTFSDTKQEALEDLRDWIESDLNEYNVKTIPELVIKMEA